MMKWLNEYLNVSYWRDVAKHNEDENRRLLDQLDGKEVYIKRLENELSETYRALHKQRYIIGRIKAVMEEDAPAKTREQAMAEAQYNALRGSSLGSSLYGGYPAYIPGVSEWWRYTP
jgi:hypothetical protein